MSEREGAISAEEARLREAAAWQARMSQDPDRKTRDAFERWLSAMPANDAAFAETEAVLALMREAADDPGMFDLRRQALARAAGAGRQRSSHGLRAAALALMLAVPTVWFGYPHAVRLVTGDAAPRAEHYHTAAGESRTIRLVDGSRVTLNTDSALQVAYSASERRLVLERGQALFQVAKEPARPFSVLSGGRRVVAHGTEFDVRIEGDLVRVALLEGSLSVFSRPGQQDASVKLRPNEVLTARGDRITVGREDVRALASWRDGLLILHDRDLRFAASEMNRYDGVRIQLADERTAAMRVSGAFRLGDNAAFVEALEAVLPLRKVRSSTNSIVLQGM